MLLILRKGPYARGISVNGARNQFLAHSAFAPDQHGGVGGSDPLDRGENLLHLRAPRDNVGMRIALAQCLTQSPVLFPEIAHVQFLMDHDAHFARENGFST